MAHYVDNDFLFKANSTDYSAYVVEVSIEPSNAVVETTAGAGTNHTQRAKGMDDTKFTVTLRYQTAAVGVTLINLFRPGQIVAIEFGPEGNTAGKPKHVQNFIVDTMPIKIPVKKDSIVLEISMSGADAASTDMFNGGAY
jgi:hypothetical protein